MNTNFTWRGHTAAVAASPDSLGVRRGLPWASVSGDHAVTVWINDDQGWAEIVVSVAGQETDHVETIHTVDDPNDDAMVLAAWADAVCQVAAPGDPGRDLHPGGLLTAMGLIAEVQPNGGIGISFSPAFAKQMEADIAAALEARFGPPIEAELMVDAPGNRADRVADSTS